MPTVITITITYDRRKESITEFTISGHAGYADPGQDIVCAGVSAISFGTINALQALLQIELAIDMEQESGFLRCVLPSIETEDTHEKAQLLLSAMVIALESIASQYGKYVTMNKVKA